MSIFKKEEKIMEYFTNSIKKLISRITGFFSKPKAKKPRTKRKNRAEIFGEYPTIKVLLNDLDRVFADVAKLSKNRISETQKIIRKFGPHVTCISEDYDTGDGVYYDRLEGFKAYGLPSVLISYYAVRNEGGVQHFFTATKTKRANFGQRRKGCVYYDVGITIVDNKLSDINNGKPIEMGFCMEVDNKTGAVKALPYQRTEMHYVRYHDKSIPGASYHTIPAKVWEYPDLFSDGETNYTQREVKDYLKHQFCLHYGMVMKRETGINIHIRKGNQKATVNIPHNDWKYFFKDRVKVKTSKGNTKPIYHAVASHFREVNGGKTAVKTHYRGARHFYWNGYEIKIVMAGKHGISAADVTLAGVDYKDKARAKTVDIVDAASQINKAIEG